MKALILLVLIVAGVNGRFKKIESILRSGVPTSDDAGILDGLNAPESGIPYQVSLRTLGNFHFCGGSIIGTRWILTAAHCLNKRSAPSIQVYAGTNFLSKGGSSYLVEQKIVHENYNKSNNRNDIALLKLSTDIELSDRVKVIDIPDEDTPCNVTILVSGWGLTSYPADSAPDHLQVLNTTTLPIKECKKHSEKAHETQICTYTRKGQGLCRGDSGGPLVYKGKVAGIVSYAVEYCAKGYPDYSTRVFSYREWINKHIKQDVLNH